MHGLLRLRRGRELGRRSGQAEQPLDQRLRQLLCQIPASTSIHDLDGE
jgi:uncharacterized protein YecE (DUF72 family)